MSQSEKQYEREELSNKWKGAPDVSNDFLFTTWCGAPACPDSMNTWLSRFIKKYSLPKISPHSFRHEAATLLITAGIDIRTVAGKLGHATPSTTQTIYSHLWQPAEHETAAVMDKILTRYLKEGE